MKSAIVVFLLMLGTAVAAELMKPTERLADVKARIDLEAQIPRAFGEWQVDPRIVPILPAADVQAKLDQLYTQVLARTYVNRSGERVMLSIAYGSDQGSQATAVHRPEFCYTSQGFKVVTLGTAEFSPTGSHLPVRQLVATRGSRVEPIVYWVTLDEWATLPGLGRKLGQIRYGLKGEIPDGMLVRVSSLERDDAAAALALHRSFVEALSRAVPAEVRGRYFGSS